MASTRNDPQDDARRQRFAAALSGAMEAKKLTLEQVAQRLAAAGTPASTATLSYWQNGRSMPTRGRSLKVLQVLENILEVPQGHLTRFLTRGDEAEWRARQVIQGSQEVEGVLSEWGLGLERRISSISVQEMARVHADGRTTTSIVRQVVRIDGEVERAMPLVFVDHTPDCVPLLEERYGARIGRTHVDASQSRIIAELLLPRPMHRGEHTWFEYQVQWAPTDEYLEGSNERRVPLLTGVLTLDVVFEGELPRNIAYVSHLVDGSPSESRRLAPMGDTVQVVLPNAAPGVHAIRWNNSDQPLVLADFEMEA